MPRRTPLSLPTMGMLVLLAACRPATTSGPNRSETGGTAGSEPGTGGTGGSGTGGKPAPVEKDGAPIVVPPEPDGRVAEPDLAPAGAEVGTDATGPLNPPVLVAAAGDIAAATGGDEATTATLLHKVNDVTPLKAILMLGDGAYRFAELAEYKKLYEPTWGIPKFKAITYAIPGNHEYLNNNVAKGYFDYWNGIGVDNGKAGPRGKGYYSFDLGAWHIIALNSNEDCKYVACGEGSEQLAFLRADLAAHPVLCTLVMVHAPRYQSGTHRGDTPALQAAWSAMYDGGVDVVLAAHEHNFQQFAPMDKTGKLDTAKGIRSFVIGTGGGRDFRAEWTTAHMATEEKRIANQSGVMFLTLEAASYGFRWLHTDGRVGAMGNGACHQ
jgi:hypothetical protein